MPAVAQKFTFPLLEEIKNRVHKNVQAQTFRLKKKAALK